MNKADNVEAVKRSCSADSFTILDKGATKLQLRMKEGMYIKRDSPVLKKQVKSYSPQSNCSLHSYVI